MTWDNSGIGIALPTNDAASFRLTSGSLLDEFFLEPNKEFANLNKLLGQNDMPLSNDAVAILINQGKINAIPAKKIPTKGGDSFVAGPYIIVDDRILLPNYKINPDGSKVLVDFRNEQLISQGVNSNGVPFSYVNTKGGNNILSDGSTKLWQKLDKALAGDATAGQTALAETKISSIPNFQAGTVLSEQGDQAQAEIQTIITEYSLLRDLNTRQDHLNSLSVDEWANNANEFSMLDARKTDRDFGLPPDTLGYHHTGERAFSSRNAVDRTSIDLMNIRMIKERQDRLLKDSLMFAKIVLPEIDATGNIIAKERTTLEIYQRSIVTGLEEAKSDTSSFLGAVSTINLWGAADQMRMADDIANSWMYKGKSGSEELMTRMKGVYDVDGQIKSTQGMHSPRSLVFQNGAGRKNLGWVAVSNTDAHINSLSKVEFSGGSSLSIGDAFNSEFALLNRINGRPATVSQVVNSAGSSQMKFFGYDAGKFSEEVRFKEWWRRFKDQWSTIGKDMPPGVSRDLHEILRHRKVQNFLAYRLKIQWDLLRSLVGDIDLNPILLTSGGASATMFLRISRIILP